MVACGLTLVGLNVSGMAFVLFARHVSLVDPPTDCSLRRFKPLDEPCHRTGSGISLTYPLAPSLKGRGTLEALGSAFAPLSFRRGAGERRLILKRWFRIAAAERLLRAI